MNFSTKFKILKESLSLSQQELADKLEVSRNTIALYLAGKRHPDFKTIKKIMDFGVSPLFLFYDEIDEPFDNSYNKFVEIKKTGNSEILDSLFDTYLEEDLVLKKVIGQLGTIKGKDFFSKIKEIATAKGERSTIFLFYFLKNIKEGEFNLNSDNLKQDFIKSINKYEFKPIEITKHFYILTENDKTNLINWIDENLDSIEVYAIIKRTPIILKTLKENVSLLNKLPLNLN